MASKFGSPAAKNPVFWFIPALLICVLVLSGLCLFLLRRQARSEETSLRDQERLSLDRVQQQFRREIETRWQMALREFPSVPDTYASVYHWGQKLGESSFGFCLDDSGFLVYPNFQLLATPIARSDDLKKTVSAAFSETADFRPQKPVSRSGPLSQEERVRRMLLAQNRGEPEQAIGLALSILLDPAEAWLSSGTVASLPASVVLLELEEISERSKITHAALVDAWVGLYQEGRFPLSSNALPWLKRLQEQCRRRNEVESWLVREKQILHQIRQIQWAEKFLPRLNLLLRRYLYNAARAQVPTQVLNSDPTEDPFLVLCRFQNNPSMRLIGMAVDLESFCTRFETAVGQAEGRDEEVVVRILRQDHLKAHADLPATSISTQPLSSEVMAGERIQTLHSDAFRGASPLSLVERRILDPWAPQFVAEARPSDFKAFERRTLQKNLLYFTLLALTIGTCGLVLFFGNRAFQEQQRLSKLRTDFLTNVSHELRTPLTAIRLHAETLEHQLSTRDSAAASNLQTILGEVDRLNLLINDVLEFTRLENLKKRYVWQSVDLVPVIRESLQLFSQQLNELGFEVSLALPESLVLPRADRAALKQCAVNLFSNCVKFSPRERYLGVRLSAQNGHALWEVEDKGIGIEPADRSQIFEKFYRAANLDAAFSGTGLGLTLCKAFVEAHGGTITCEDAISGKGSRFVIRLPIQTNS